ncbi:MAG TPA: hypothetical protein VLJ21_04235 [Candidatus Binatia bacterium]|nr:hypothetical protein [Candidatus Binatia bacterium]
MNRHVLQQLAKDIYRQVSDAGPWRELEPVMKSLRNKSLHEWDAQLRASFLFRVHHLEKCIADLRTDLTICSIDTDFCDAASTLVTLYQNAFSLFLARIARLREGTDYEFSIGLRTILEQLQKQAAYGTLKKQLSKAYVSLAADLQTNDFACFAA